MPDQPEHEEPSGDAPEEEAPEPAGSSSDNDAPATDEPAVSDQDPAASAEDAPAAEEGPAAGDEQPDPPRESFERRALHEVVHVWIPLAIVLVSVCAAIVGWRASLADERATHYEELSRQDLVQQQQQLIQDYNSVDSDIQTFGQFAEESAMAHSLLHDANVVGGAVGDEMRTEGGADLAIALSLGKEIQNVDYAFDPSNPEVNVFVRSDGTYPGGHPYNAGQALATAENNDFSLHGLEPEALLATAESQHNRGVDFTGIAALFIGVLVLLTFGAVVKGPQKLWFAASGALLAVAGLSLFFVTQFS